MGRAQVLQGTGCTPETVGACEPDSAETDSLIEDPRSFSKAGRIKIWTPWNISV